MSGGSLPPSPLQRHLYSIPGFWTHPPYLIYGLLELMQRHVHGAEEVGLMAATYSAAQSPAAPRESKIVLITIKPQPRTP